MAFANAKFERPALKCLKCGEMAFLSNYLWGPLHFHVYACPSCGGMNASPTQYSRCEKLGLIAKDLAANDCLLCPIPKKEGVDLKVMACPHYMRKVTREEFKEEMEKLVSIGENIRLKRDAVMTDDAKESSKYE